MDYGMPSRLENMRFAVNSTESYEMINSTEKTVVEYSNTTINSTYPSDPGRDESLAKVEIGVQAVIFFLAVFGNGLVLLVLLGLRRKKLNRMNLMIVHLSCADLFVAFFNVLPQLIWDITHHWQGGDFSCRFVKYFQIVAMYASSYVLVSTAIDRYLAICHPLKTHSWTSGKIHALVGAAWAFSLVFSIPQLIIFAFRETSAGSGVYDCWAVFRPKWTLPLYVTWFAVAIYIIPLLLLAIAYGRISYVVWKSMKAREPSKVQGFKSRAEKTSMVENGSLLCSEFPHGNATHDGGNHAPINRPALPTVSSRKETQYPRAHVRGMSKAKVKTVKLTLTVIVCYLICWGPFFVSQMWAAWDINAPFKGFTMTIMVLLASLNSCTNPWICLAFSDTLQRRVRQCFARPRVLGSKDRQFAGTFDSESRFRSTTMSQTETSRIEPSIFESSFSIAEQRGANSPYSNSLCKRV